MSEKQKRVVCRTRTKRNKDGTYQVITWDQGNNRFEEADFHAKDLQEARDKAQDKVNKSKGAEE